MKTETSLFHTSHEKGYFHIKESGKILLQNNYIHSFTMSKLLLMHCSSPLIQLW